MNARDIDEILDRRVDPEFKRILDETIERYQGALDALAAYDRGEVDRYGNPTA